jgi:hypothetical protein
MKLEVPETGRIIRNIREYPSGLIVCFDQNVKKIDDLYGPRGNILPKLEKEDLSKAIIKRMARKGKGDHTKWVEVSHQRFFLSK